MAETSRKCINVISFDNNEHLPLPQCYETSRKERQFKLSLHMASHLYQFTGNIQRPKPIYIGT